MSVAGTQQLQWQIEAQHASIGGFLSLAWAIGKTEEQITLILTGAPTGLVGTLTVSIVTVDGATAIYLPTTTGIAEVPAGSGRYVASVPKPDIGTYFVVWRAGGTTTFAPLEITLFSINATHLRVLKAPTQPLDDGDLMEFAITISDHGGALVDPETLTLSVDPPGGPSMVYTYGVDDLVIRDSVGTYRATVPVFAGVAMPSTLTRFLGSWRWESSGDYQDAEEGRFLIRRSLVAA